MGRSRQGGLLLRRERPGPIPWSGEQECRLGGSACFVGSLGHDGAMTDYSYSNMTSAIDAKASPLRQYLDSTFPNMRPLQTDYRSRAGTMKVAPLPGGGGANGGTLGEAFDFRMRFLLDPTYVPDIAFLAFMERPDYVEAIHGVIRRAGDAAVQGHAASTDVDRACWALALCTEVYRTGKVFPGSALTLVLDDDDFTAERLLSLIPDDACRQLKEMDELAQEHLLPHLSAPFNVGPTFDGSSLCSADADLISDGLLLDFKTAVKGNALPRKDLYQLLGYTLFDHSDRYGIDRVGIYSARFGALISWDLEPTLELLAGEPIDLTEQREKVWGLLGGSTV